jgi:hypothetical protein
MAAKRGKWGAEIRARFLELLRETGNVAATLRVIGHPNMFYKRRRRDPGFAAAWAAAVAGADAALAAAESAFPGSPQGTVMNGCPRFDGTAEELGGYLRPGRKPAQARPQVVIRRTSNGKAQLGRAREGHMTAEREAEFLALLRATGNFAASARAIGFQPASLHQRERQWPAFARACQEAIEAASVQWDYALVAHAHMLLGIGPSTALGMGEEEAGATVPFDPEAAMRIIGFLDRRKAGRAGGRHKGAPERSFEEVVESIMSKIEAIERHEAMFGKEEGDEGGGEDA